MPKGTPNKKLETIEPKPVEPIAKTETVPVSTSEQSPKVDGLASAPAPTASTRSSQAETVKDKILVVLDDSGGIDFGSMREKTKEKFVKALRRSEGDLFPKAAEVAGLAIPDEAVAAIFNLIGVGETMLASSKFPPAIAAQAFMWTKPEIDMIKNPAKALLAKYAPKLRGFEVETTFALVFVQIHFGKMHVLRTLMSEYEARVQAEKVALNKTPGPKPGDNKADAMPGDISPGDSPVPEVQ